MSRPLGICRTMQSHTETINTWLIVKQICSRPLGSISIPDALNVHDCFLMTLLAILIVDVQNSVDSTFGYSPMYDEMVTFKAMFNTNILSQTSTFIN